MKWIEFTGEGGDKVHVRADAVVSICPAGTGGGVDCRTVASLMNGGTLYLADPPAEVLARLDVAPPTAESFVLGDIAGEYLWTGRAFVRAAEYPRRWEEVLHWKTHAEAEAVRRDHLARDSHLRVMVVRGIGAPAPLD